MKKRLALFDFDGTISKKDSFLEFLQFYKGTFSFYFGFGILSPIMGLFVFKIIPNWKAKEVVLRYFFKGEDISFFKAKCEAFAQEILPLLIRPKALKALEDHKMNGDRVVIISASAEDWLSSWCKKYEFELIATKLEVKDKKITGRIAGLNCYGKEKECRLKAYLDINDFDEIHVYGDSIGDKDILQLATHPFFRPFH